MCISLFGFSQDLKKITKTIKTPDGWAEELAMDTTYVPMFGKKAMAIWKFECKKVKIHRLNFTYLIMCRPIQLAMLRKADMYYATSNCLVASNEDIQAE